MWFDIESLNKSYGPKGTPAERFVLKNLSLQVGQGETVAITGPSGSGKTTLLNLLAALDRPDSGRILFQGKDLGGYNERQLDAYRQREIGIVFQLHHLLPQCSLFENVLIPALAVYRRVPQEVTARAEMLIRRMGLWEVRHQRPSELSGGECQRAAVARAMINDPKVLLADEPTGSLDRTNALGLVDLFLEVCREQGKTLILVTHSKEVADRMQTVRELSEGSFKGR